MIRRVAAILGLTLWMGTQSGWAHEAPENSASIIVREQAVELRLSLDLLNLLQNTMPIPVSWDRAEDVAPRLELAKRNVQGASLKLDGQSIDMELVRFPSLQEAMEAHHMHEEGEHMRSTAILRGRLPDASRGALSLQLPAELGPIITSFSRPLTVWVKPHGKAVFQLKASAPSELKPWSQAGLLLLSGTLLWGIWRRRS